MYLSGRNIPDTDIRIVDELNAYEVLRRRKLIFSKQAVERLVNNPATMRAQASQESEG